MARLGVLSDGRWGVLLYIRVGACPTRGARGGSDRCLDRDNCPGSCVSVDLDKDGTCCIGNTQRVTNITATMRLLEIVSAAAALVGAGRFPFFI